MIALLSAQIEAGARAVATVLVRLLPFLPDSLVTNPEQIMIIVALAGQGPLRAVHPAVAVIGEAGVVVIPIAFWYFSIGGGAVLLLYAVSARIR